MVITMREYLYIDAAKEDKVMLRIFKNKWKPIVVITYLLRRRDVCSVDLMDPARGFWCGRFESITTEHYAHPGWSRQVPVKKKDIPGHHPRKKIISPLEVYSDPAVQNSIPPAKTCTEAEVNRMIDFDYLVGVFNTSGIDGLHAELSRLKGLGKEPHQFINRNRH